MINNSNIREREREREREIERYKERKMTESEKKSCLIIILNASNKISLLIVTEFVISIIWISILIDIVFKIMPNSFRKERIYY